MSRPPSPRSSGAWAEPAPAPTPTPTLNSGLLEIVRADWALPAHREALVGLIDAYARDPMAGEQGLNPETRARLPEALAAFPTAHAFFAFRDGAPLGAAVCFLGFSTFAAKPVLNVHDMIVLPDHRGQGIGKRLLAAVDEKARELGCCKVTLEVREDNHRAYGLYRHHGYRDMDFGGEASRVLFLEKALKDPL